MKGIISSVEDHGSIVIVWLGLDDGRSSPIYIDRRAFFWLLDGEGCEPDDLIGRSVGFDGEVIQFKDTLEVA